MAQNDVVFIKGQNGLGRPLDGKDFISSLVFYSATLPIGFSTVNRINKLSSVADAVSLGITNTHGDETPATGTITFTASGTAADIVSLPILTPSGIVGLGSFAVPTTPTPTNVAAAAVISINAGTLTHGYKASSLAAVVALTLPSGLGLSGNSGYVIQPIVASGSTAATIAQPSGGAASTFDVMYYHVAEFFRMQPKGLLYIGIYPIPTVLDFSELQLVQNFASGDIRQFGVYYTAATFSTTQVDALEAQAIALEAAHKPVSILYAPNIFGAASVTTLANVRALTDPDVSVVIGQDGGNIGAALYTASGKSISCLGAALGVVAKAGVADNIGAVEKFNLSNVELDVLAFSNGQLYKSLSDNAITTVHNLGYIFAKKHTDVTGSYFNDSFTCVASTSDYAYIENNRVMDKAERGIRAAMIVKLNGKLQVNPTTGRLSEDVIAMYTNVANAPLEAMEKAGELSGHKVVIDPTQNVLATSKLVLTIQNVPVGVARLIQINIGYTTKL